jgi:hypothetical protein
MTAPRPCADTGASNGLAGAAFTGFAVFGCGQGVGNAVDVHLCEFQSQLGRSGNSAGVICGRDASANVCAARRDFDAIDEQRLIQERDKGRSGLARFAVDGIDELDRDLAARGNRVAGCCRIR